MESTVRKFETSAVTDHEIFQDATYRSLHENLDEVQRFNRHYYGWTAALLAVMVIGGGLAVYKAIESLPY